MRRVGALVLFTAFVASCSLATDLGSLGGPDGAASDALTDDAPPTDAGASCPGYPLAFACDDFADGFAPFWKQNVWGDAGISPSDAQYVSPPLALLAQTPNVPDSGSGPVQVAASLEYDRFGVGMKHVRSSYDLYLDQLGNRSAAIGGV